MAPGPPDPYSCTRPRRPGKAIQHSQELSRLLHRFDIIMRSRGETITPYENPETCCAKCLESILIRLIIANIDKEHAGCWPTYAHAFDDPA